MTSETVPVTDELLDAAAAALRHRLEAIADIASEAMGRPAGSRHVWLDGTHYDPETNGNGRILCDVCGKPLAAHPLTGGHR